MKKNNKTILFASIAVLILSSFTIINQRSKINTHSQSERISFKIKGTGSKGILNSTNVSLIQANRNLDSPPNLPENSNALSDSARLVYITSKLISQFKTVSSGALGDLNSDGYDDMILVLQDTVIDRGENYSGYIYELPVVFNIYFWNNGMNRFEMECSNSRLLEFWNLGQGEQVYLEIRNDSIHINHDGASGSHYQSEEMSFDYNKESNDFLMQSYYYNETSFRNAEVYEYRLDFQAKYALTSSGDSKNLNTPSPSLRNFPDTNWLKAIDLLK